MYKFYIKKTSQENDHKTENSFSHNNTKNTSWSFYCGCTGVLALLPTAHSGGVTQEVSFITKPGNLNFATISILKLK